MKKHRLLIRLRKGKKISIGIQGYPGAIGEIKLDDSCFLESVRLIFECPLAIRILRSDAKAKKYSGMDV